MTSHSNRRHNITRSALLWMLLLGATTSACTGSHAIGPAVSPTLPITGQASSAKQQNDLVHTSPSGIASFTDQLGTQNSTDRDDTDDESCTTALYWADEPLSSHIQQTSAADLEQQCADGKSACMTRCLNNPKPPYPAQKKGDRAHFALCHKRCFKQFMECLRKAGLVQEFSVLDTALAWVKSHGKEIVGTIVVIGGIAYIVSTGGSGALILVVL